MKRKHLIAFGLSLGILAIIIVFLSLYGPSLGIYLRKPSPQDYGARALAFMDNGYYASTDEWLKAKETARNDLENAHSYQDTWPILREALVAAGGKHSRLITPEVSATASEEAITLPLVSSDRMENGILTVVIPEFTHGSKEEYAAIIISWLQGHQDAKGVVIDLRGNTGGDIAPMIAALSPLLPDGEVLHTMYANGQLHAMTLKDGHFSGGSRIKSESFKMPITIPIAILTDERTASSGEAVLLAFRGMENVRSFGAPTAGYASANTVFRLYDGTQVVLTIGADVCVRTREVFCEDPIPPDVLSDNPEQDAVAWIEEYPSRR